MVLIVGWKNTFRTHTHMHEHPGNNTHTSQVVATQWANCLNDAICLCVCEDCVLFIILKSMVPFSQVIQSQSASIKW